MPALKCIENKLMWGFAKLIRLRVSERQVTDAAFFQCGN